MLGGSSLEPLERDAYKTVPAIQKTPPVGLECPVVWFIVVSSGSVESPHAGPPGVALCACARETAVTTSVDSEGRAILPSGPRREAVGHA